MAEKEETRQPTHRAYSVNRNCLAKTSPATRAMSIDDALAIIKKSVVGIDRRC